jgi:hypothetical protein
MSKTYVFKARNATVEISATGDYANGCKDIDASFDGGDRSWEEVDDADEIIQWLVDCGVEFESDRSMAFNRAYVQHVLIEGDATEAELLYEATAWTDADIARKLQFIER